jgi:hypothetical protein
MAASNQSTQASIQLDLIFKSLDAYGRGDAKLSTLDSSSVTAPKGANSNPSLDPVQVNKTSATRRAAQMAPSLMSLAAALAKDPQLGQAAGLVGLGVRAAQPGVTAASLAPSFLGTVGNLTNTPVLGQIATALNIADKGITTPGAMGILGMFNPAMGLAGLVNSIAGNPIGTVADSIRDSLVSNPNSINSLANAGVSVTQQAYNNINQNQVDDMDTESMDRLMESLNKDPMNDSSPRGSNDSGYGGGDGMGEGGGRGDSGMGSARGPGE